MILFIYVVQLSKNRRIVRIISDESRYIDIYFSYVFYFWFHLNSVPRLGSLQFLRMSRGGLGDIERNYKWRICEIFFLFFFLESIEEVATAEKAEGTNNAKKTFEFRPYRIRE